MNLCERVNIRLKISEMEYRYAFLNPKTCEIVLVRGIEIWTDKNNQRRVQIKTESNLYGSTMREDVFNKRYPICLGDIGVGSTYEEMKKSLIKTTPNR